MTTRLALLVLAVALSACDGGGAGDNGTTPPADDVTTPPADDGSSSLPMIALTLAGPPGLSADSVTLVSSVRVNRTVFDYTYTARATNGTGAALRNVTATVTSDATTTVVTDSTLAFGDLAAGASATSTDTFTIRQDRTAPVSAANLTITLMAASPPAVGVLLEGEPESAAMAAIPDLEPPPVTVADLAGPFILTRVTLVIAPDATVAEVNSALDGAGAGIVSAEAGNNRLGLAVPRQPSAAALEALARSLGARPGILLALPGITTAATLAPESTANAAELMHHLRDARFPAAWNAHALAEGCTPGIRSERVAVIVVDRFSRPHDPLYIEIDSASDAQLPPIVETGVGTVDTNDAGGRHGYDAMMTALARFDSVSLTGAMPFLACIDLVGLQIGYETNDDILKALDRSLNTLDNFGEKAIVNYSLGYATECALEDCPGGFGATSAVFRATWGFITREVLQRHEQTALITASAGNEADKPWSIVYPGYGIADFDSVMNVAARSDGNASWIENQPLWEPAPNCAPTCFRPLMASPGDLATFDELLGTLPPTVASPARNVVIVGSTDGITNSVSRFSSPDADVFAVGERVPSLQGPIQGTSFAAPQVAGLAAYLWLLSPDLRALPAESTAKALIDNRNAATDMVDAYRTILALDSGRALSPAASHVRRAILNAVGDQDPASGTFDEADLAAFEEAYHPGGATPEPADPDYGRFDLNGDGYTGGTRHTSFDLDPQTSPAFGRAVQTQLTEEILGTDVTFEENSVTDEQILCYYAFSPLFQGDALTRDQLLAAKCAKSPAGHTVLTGQVTQTILFEFDDYRPVPLSPTHGTSVATLPAFITVDVGVNETFTVLNSIGTYSQVTDLFDWSESCPSKTWSASGNVAADRSGTTESSVILQIDGQIDASFTEGCVGVPSGTTPFSESFEMFFTVIRSQDGQSIVALDFNRTDITEPAGIQRLEARKTTTTSGRLEAVP